MPDKPKDRADEKRWLVLHEGVGRHVQGAVVSVDDLGGKDADMARLVELGAVRELSRSEIAERADAAVPDGGSEEAHRPDLTTGNPHPAEGLKPPEGGPKPAGGNLQSPPK